METTMRKFTISVLMVTFGLLCAISPPVFAGDKYPNYEAPEAVIAQAKKEGKVVIYDWAEWWPGAVWNMRMPRAKQANSTKKTAGVYPSAKSM